MNEEGPEQKIENLIHTKICEVNKEYKSFGYGLKKEQIEGKPFFNESNEEVGYVKSFNEETGEAIIVVTKQNTLRYFEKEVGQLSVRGIIELG